jgi:hypothetical protein
MKVRGNKLNKIVSKSFDDYMTLHGKIHNEMAKHVFI